MQLPPVGTDDEPAVPSGPVTVRAGHPPHGVVPGQEVARRHRWHGSPVHRRDPGHAPILLVVDTTADPRLPLVAGPGAETVLRAAADDDRTVAVLVHQGVELSSGAPQRLLAEIARPGRRMVRVLADGTGCYLLDRDLLRRALDRVGTEALLADADGLDGELARALGVDPDRYPTDVADLSTGAWRHWVDGEVIGVRAAGGPDGWAAAVERRHSLLSRAKGSARTSAGRARRALARRSDRRQAQPR